jgi:hypothetical protein
MLLVAGLLLGILSRIEELTDGFYLAISTHATWVLAPFAAGVLSAEPRRGALRGAVLLTAANVGYYGWSAVAQPDVPLESVAGSVPHWFAAGIAAGVVFGALGGLTPRARLAAPAAVVAVIVADALNAFALVLP